MANLLDRASVVLTPTAYNNGEVLCVKPDDGSGDFQFSRNSAATRFNSQGLVEDVQIISGNKVINGDFSNGSTGWTIENTWTIGDGVANGNGASGSGEELKQSGVLISGRTYSATYEVKNYVSGTVRTERPLGSIRSANGVYTEILTAQTLIKFRGNNFNGSITNVVFKEITNDTNLPRINYEGFSYDGSGNIIPDSGCGSWLFEPQSTNLITQSEALSTMQFQSVVTDNNLISPTGDINASLVVENTATNIHGIRKTSVIPTNASATTYTISVFAKKKERQYIQFGFNAEFAATNSSGFDLENGTTLGNASTHKIVDFGNGWYKCSFTASITQTTGGFNFVNIAIGTSINSFFYAGDGTSGLYMFGYQVEQQSSATSYIPTDGSQKTRNKDVCTNGGSVSTINSTEGVLYAEIAALVEVDNARRFITLNDGSASNGVVLRYEATGVINARYQIGGVAQCSISFATTITNTHKVAFKYAENDFALWVDGVEVGIDDVGSVLGSNTINSIDFDHGGGAFPFFGKTKCLAVWKEALTDTELQELTTI